MQDFDLIIAGMGPVGATAANLAAKYGLKTLIVDKAADLYPNPRALGIDHEAMRVFAEIGIADEIASAVMPYRPSEYRSSSDRVIKRIDAAKPPYLLGWAPNYVFDQPKLERVLRARALSLPGVDVRLQTEVIAADNGANGCTVVLRHHDGSEETVTSQFVLACDGGSSQLRTRADLQLEDLDFDEPWLVVDVKLNPGGGLTLPETNVQYCEIGRPSTFVIGVGEHRRWEFMINPDESPQDVIEPAFISKLLSRWMQPDEYTLWRASAYRFHALVARQWRSGNIFLLGDAAHMTPPFLAQGLCQGIRDVSNLMWKLAFVIGGANDSVLETYQQERIEHVKKTTLVAKTFGEVICERDAERAELRDQRLMAEMGTSAGITVRQSLIPGLVHGFLGGSEFRLQGVLMPQSIVRDDSGAERLMDDFSPCAFTLVVATDIELGEVYRELTESAELAGFPVKIMRIQRPDTSGPLGRDLYADVSGVVSEWMTSNQCNVILARPDHYIYGAGLTGADALSLLRSAAAATYGQLNTTIRDRVQADMQSSS